MYFIWLSVGSGRKYAGSSCKTTEMKMGDSVYG
jgi:hypothetical protein